MVSGEELPGTIGTPDLRQVVVNRVPDGNVDDRFDLAENPLALAAAYGNGELVSLLLDQGDEVDMGSENVITALTQAAANGHTEIVSLMLDRGAGVNMQRGWLFAHDNALIQAAAHGHKETVSLLLDRGADVDITNDNQNTALVEAAGEGHKEIVSLLLDRGSLVDMRNDDGDTALIKAAEEGHNEIVSLLLDRGARVDMTNDNGNTALIEAAGEGHREITSLLLDRGARVGVKNTNQNTPLIAAAWRGHTEVVSLLLDRGAELDMKNSGGNTALIIAARNAHEDTVSLLLDRGADVRIKNDNGNTALIVAGGKAHDGIVTLLLDRGADVDVQNNNGNTTLILAAGNTHEETVSLLLNRGAEVDLKNNHGNTALIKAAGMGYHKIVSLLLDRGAQVCMQNNDGNPALLVAAGNSHVETVSVLLDRGAKVDMQNNNGNTALIKAAGIGHDPLVSLLLDRGADANATANSGIHATPLIAAACAGELLKQRSVTNRARKNYESVVLRLLDRGARVNAVAIGTENVYGTALIAAAATNQIEMVSLLLNYGAETDTIAVGSSFYGTALIAAAAKGSGDAATLLLDRGAKVNTVAVGNLNACQTALMAAAANGSNEILSLLLDRGAKIDAMTSGTCPGYGNALIAATVAAVENRSAIVIFLSNRGANLNSIVCSHHYPTALIALTRLTTTLERTDPSASAMDTHLELMKILLKRGAKINLAVEDDQYGTALNTAVFITANEEASVNRSHRSRVVSGLLDCGADPNIVTGEYGTALGIAAYEGNEECVSFLLSRGADIYHIGGKYPTSGGEYPTVVDAALAGARARITKRRAANRTAASDGNVSEAMAASELQTMGSLRKLLSRHSSSTSSKLWAPFPMPYTETYLPPTSPSDPTVDTTISTFTFSPRGDLTPEQASWPCKTLDTKLLIKVLVALMELNPEAVERHQVWIHNDVRYIISKGYDLGLAYAACRVAWKDFNNKAFNVAAHRARWHEKAHATDAARADLIYRDSETEVELIKSPYQVMPRRIWDLKSNRVVEFRMLLSDFLARRTCSNSNLTSDKDVDGCTNSVPDMNKDASMLSPGFWAITHSWTKVMKPLETAINLYQWPVPFPEQVHRDGGAGLRQELLQLGAAYVWLDVLCLRQQSGTSPGSNHSPQTRTNEWKLDVPTIGNVYRIATGLVRYFNGLGLPFSGDGWDDDRHWLRRAWTLQEIKSENTTLNGGRSHPNATAGSLMSARGTFEGKPTILRHALRPVVQLAAEVDSPTGCSVYDLAREMAKRFATQPTDKVAGLLYLLRTTQLPTYDESISAEDAWRHCIQVLPFERKVEILCDFPYRGAENHWFPTWSQLLEWPQRDPQYVHARSVWRPENLARLNRPRQISIFVPNIWVIPNVQRVHSREPSEYHFHIEGSDSTYEFYYPYLHQNPIPLPLKPSSRLALATVSLGHSNSWVVCEMRGPRSVRYKSENGADRTTFMEFEVLRKIGVLATDSCSELFIHAGTSWSQLRKMNCLFT